MREGGTAMHVLYNVVELQYDSKLTYLSSLSYTSLIVFRIVHRLKTGYSIIDRRRSGKKMSATPKRWTE